MSASASYAEAMRDVLSAEYGRLKHGEKILARDARSTPRAAKNWLTGANAPNGENLINLMRRCAALRQEINRLVGESECGPGSEDMPAGSGAAS
jgi:hypothetical protein